MPTVYSFSLGVQHELGGGTTLDVAYVGTLSRHLVTSRDINAIPYGYAFTAGVPGSECVRWQRQRFPGGLILSPAGSRRNMRGRLQLQRISVPWDDNSYTDALLVPFKGYGQMSYMEFDGTSNYNSLQASLQRRFSKGLTFGAVYTWSKSQTTANSDQDTQDPFNCRSLDYRSASWDRRHVFAANYVYDLPGLTKHFSGPKWLSYITDNYQLSGVTQYLVGNTDRPG